VVGTAGQDRLIVRHQAQPQTRIADTVATVETGVLGHKDLPSILQKGRFSGLRAGRAAAAGQASLDAMLLA
jgi:hypothetical protein